MYGFVEGLSGKEYGEEERGGSVVGFVVDDDISRYV